MVRTFPGSGIVSGRLGVGGVAGGMQRADVGREIDGRGRSDWVGRSGRGRGGSAAPQMTLLDMLTLVRIQARKLVLDVVSQLLAIKQEVFQVNVQLPSQG